MSDGKHTATWECIGRKQSLPAPGECSWPGCGCDPAATKVIESLLEQGWGPSPAAPQGAQLVNVLNEAALVVERWSLPTIQTPSMWLVDKAGIAADIRALASGSAGAASLLSRVERMTKALEAVDRLRLIIESAVRNADPKNRQKILDMLRLVRAALSTGETKS